MKKLWIVVVVLAVVGCGVLTAAYTSHASNVLDGIIYWPSYHARQSILLDSLVDPDSARIRGLYFRKLGGRQYMCGEVNARNRMGGYTGYKLFYVDSYRVVFSGEDSASWPQVVPVCYGS